MIEEKAINFKYKGGGSIVEIPPTFSNDGQYLLISCDNNIISYNVKTGKKYITYEGLENDVIGFGSYFLDEVEYVVASSKDGNIIVWKLNSGLKIKSMKVTKNPIVNFKVVKENFMKNYAFISWIYKSCLKVCKLNLDNGKMQDIAINIPLITLNCCVDIGGTSGDHHLAAVNKNILYFVKINQTEKVIKQMIPKKLRFTCVACNYENGDILTGDTKGQVLLWQNLSRNVATAKFHWHTLPVNTVAFSSSGNYFYSGGNECVLVKWNINDPFEKQFLPRMSSYIHQIVLPCDNSMLAVATEDNAIHVLNTQRNLISTIQHFVKAKKYQAGIKYDNRTKSLIVNGIVGHLQFYSPMDKNLLYNLDIVAANRITDERDTSMANIEVINVAISKSGNWMATMEERTDNYMSYDTYESRLKFWNFDAKKQTFELNTFVTHPHKRKMFDMKFQPTNDENLKCITIGDDKFFKIWQITPKSNKVKEFTWTCSSAAFYKEYIPKSLAFSYDGSLLAISFAHILTIWLPNSCEIKSSLVHPLYNQEIIGVGFGIGQQSHLLVSASKSRLNVWNLLSLSLMWTVSIEISLFICEPLCPYMAVFTQQLNLYIFNPASSTPLYKHSEHVDVITAAIVPNMYVSHEDDWYHKAKLFIIDSNKKLFCLESDDEVIESIQFISEETNNSIFYQLLPNIKSSAPLEQYKPVVHSYTKPTRRAKLSYLLDTPVHTMAPIFLLCQSILSSMILEVQTEAKSGFQEEEEKGRIKESTALTETTKEVVNDLFNEELEDAMNDPPITIINAFLECK